MVAFLLFIGLLITSSIALSNSFISSNTKLCNLKNSFNPFSYISQSCKRGTDGPIGNPFGEVVRELRRKYPNKHDGNDFIYKTMIEWYMTSVDDSSRDLTIFLLRVLDGCYRCKKIDVAFNDYQKFHIIQYRNEIQSYRDMYPGMEAYLQEVFYFHHGLRFARDSIKDYIRKRSIMDIGAFIGDSLLVLLKYTDQIVYSYDMSRKNMDKCLNNARKQNISSDKYILIEKGIGGTIGKVTIDDGGHGGVSLGKVNQGIEVIVTTIDAEVQERNITVGFIKADVEGFGYDLLLGAVQTIKKYRPVFSLSMYHSFDEFFNMRVFLSKYDYVFEIHSENEVIVSAGEVSLFAVPREVYFQ